MSNIKKFLEYIKEDGESTSASIDAGGNAYATSASGMGDVVSPQPGVYAGQAGTTGSGDIGVPYNSGGQKAFMKLPALMGSNHGPRTGKKSRMNPNFVRTLKRMKSDKKHGMSPKSKEDYKSHSTVEKPSKVMSFDNFMKNDVNNIKRD